MKHLKRLVKGLLSIVPGIAFIFATAGTVFVIALVCVGRLTPLFLIPLVLLFAYGVGYAEEKADKLLTEALDKIPDDWCDNVQTTLEKTHGKE